MPEEKTALKVREVLTLNKFDGDIDPETGPPPGVMPVETLTLEDGVVTHHKKGGEVLFDRDKKIDKRGPADTGTPYRPYPDLPVPANPSDKEN